VAKKSINALCAFFLRQGHDAAYVRAVGRPLELAMLPTRTRPFALMLGVLESADLCTAIATLTGKQAVRIKFVSLARRFKLPPEDPRTRRESMSTGFQIGGSPLWKIAKQHLGPRIAKFDTKTRDLARMVDAVWFGEDFRWGLNRAYGPILGTGIYNALRTSIYYYLVFGLVNEQHDLKAMAQVVALLDRAIILGELAGEPGTWLVLTA
jgi:hypothetical protein